MAYWLNSAKLRSLVRDIYIALELNSADADLLADTLAVKQHQ